MNLEQLEIKEIVMHKILFSQFGRSRVLIQQMHS